MNHLHVRSCYSLLESPYKVDAIVDSALRMGFRHACLTEHNNMYSVMRFWKTCKDKGIHPIIGLETEVNIDDKEYHFVLLAMNDLGLKGLYKISSEKMKWDSNLSFEDFVLNTQNCIVMSAGDYEDQLGEDISHEKEEEITSFLSLCQSKWNHFYVSIAMNDSSFHRQKNVYLKQLCQSLSIPTVALSRVYYEKKEDVEKLRILRAISKQTVITDQTLDVTYNRYFRSNEEMIALYEEDDLRRSDEICAMCNVQMAYERSSLPVFKNKYNVDSKTYLTKLCQVGLKKRLNNQYKEEYVSRLNYELNVITSMGFTDYFLIVWDYIRYARSENIMVGPGRGSAAGSLVAYCLGITHIDPIENDLLFERFLNPDRISMPDIDTDFPDDRRDEVMKYVHDLYGSDHVSHIVTFNTLKAKQVLRDVARCIGMPNRKVDEMTKLIGNALNMTLMRAYEENNAFKKLIHTDEKCRQLFEMCLPLEGLPRHISLHAAGLVFSKQPIVEVCPLVQVDSSSYATQYTMEYLEELGLIKMDFLGLRNLSTIHQIVDTIQREKHIELDVLKLPLNDSKTYQLLSRGDTLGVFQLESSGIKQLLMKMKPNSFEDICAVLALYRPGPMHNIEEYILRKNDPSRITYIHPKLKPILQETYGIMIYQEQIMQIAQVIGGFSLAQADSLRKAMSKKKMDMMESYKQQFIQGAYRNGCQHKQAEEIFSTMERFAEYGFNKSHSYAYGLIAYQMAYLKTNYPLYFYQCLLDSVIGSENKSSEYIYECQKRNIRILPPSVQYSQSHYVIEKDAIRMPLQVLKGIGKSVYPLIIEEREKGLYEGYIDFVVRAKSNKIGDSILQTLIDGGALDGFEYNRETMKQALPGVLNYAHLVCTETSQGVLLNYDIVSKPAITKVSENKMVKSQNEFNVLGFYLTLHPVKEIREKNYPKCCPLKYAESVDGYIEVIGKVVGYRNHKTKNGEWMCFMTIEDENAKLDVVIMPNLYKQERENIQKDALVCISGKKDRPQSVLARYMKWIHV